MSELAGANTTAATWCEELNSAERSEICAVPALRLALMPLMDVKGLRAVFRVGL